MGHTGPDITNIANEILKDDQLAIMDEHIFVEHFLPYFKDNTLSDRDAKIAKWIEYADGAMKEVIVVDKEGTEIFRVPPVISSIDVEKTLDTSYNELEAHVDREKDRLPIRAGKEHEMLLNQAIDSVKPVSYKNRWITIYERYKEKDTIVLNDTPWLDEDEISF